MLYSKGRYAATSCSRARSSPACAATTSPTWSASMCPIPTFFRGAIRRVRRHTLAAAGGRGQSLRLGGAGTGRMPRPGGAGAAKAAPGAGPARPEPAPGTRGTRGAVFSRGTAASARPWCCPGGPCLPRRRAGGRYPPTALFAANNTTALGVTARLTGAGRKDVALVTFDDLPLADVLDPALTVVAQDPAAIGEAAATTALARLDGDRTRARTIMVPTRLVVRGSSEPGAPATR
ncbi:substrate-binding domain-containing protein [Streptomyces sp. NPDC058740]|uniref:substrate-binding domain-containing protein n=1 Tax=Streptomyces sp. NPDC058740 TaxID=3346619 RepID=UPI0036C7221D